MSLESFLQLIRQGEPVTPGTANRPLREMDQHVRYIWEVLQAAAIGSTVYARRVTIEADAKKGMAVYFNTKRKQFERGLAQLDTTPASGVLQTADTAQIWGVIATKHNATLADILLYGYDDINILEATGGDTSAGVYYLSGTTPGRLTKQRPPVSVPVLRADGQGKVFVMPQFVDFLDRHTHYKFPLTCAPAGDHSPPTPGERHTIDNANADLPGWLPADHPTFAGKAPAGAAFGYNFEAHPQLKNAWPPLPATQTYLEWNKGLDKDIGFTGVPLGADGLCVINRDGIWWMSDCYGDVPWPTDYDSTGSESYSDSSDVKCPRHLQMAMLLWFTKAQFATDVSVVRSLRSKDARIKVRCIDGSPATAGDLEVLLDLNLTVKNDEKGHLALKAFDPVKNEFKRGPVVEGVYARSNNVSLSGSETELRNIGGTERTLFKGVVGVEVAPSDSRELDVQLIRLDSVEEQFYQDTTYLGFAASQQSEIRCKIHVPSDTELANPQLALRFRLLGRGAGTLPALTVTARRCPRPTDGLNIPVALPTSASEFTVTIDTQATLASGNTYVEAESEPFEVAAGDVVFFTVKRLSTDGYASEVGILQQVGILIAGEDEE